MDDVDAVRADHEKPKPYFANVSAITDGDGFWRVFYYAPG